MKVDILDHEVFHSIAPEQVEMYLENRLWVRRKKLPNDVSIWDLLDEEGKTSSRVWLPEATDLADYPEAMARLVKALADAEDRSQLELVSDFETVGIGDVIRLRGYDSLNRASHTLPYQEGADLIQRARDMLVTGAMSVNQPKPIYSGKSNMVRDFEDALRLGQTEPGSYVVKLIAPLDSDLPDTEVPKSEPNLPIPDIMTPMPFSRRAVLRMADGLNMLLEIGREAERTGKYHFAPFLQMVPSGVSANLCEAVSNSRNTQMPGRLEVEVSWSYTIAIPEQMPRVEIEFPETYMKYYRQASEDFRKQKEPEKRSIEGFVKVLQREHSENYGMISLAAIIDGRPRVVRMKLEGEAYKTAVRSHQEDIYAQVTGVLEPKGARFWLQSPENFKIVESLSLFD